MNSISIAMFSSAALCFTMAALLILVKLSPLDKEIQIKVELSFMLANKLIALATGFWFIAKLIYILTGYSIF